MGRSQSCLVLVAGAVVLGLVGSCAWLVWRITERTVRAIDTRWGNDFWLLLAAALFLAVATIAVGGAVALVRRWLRHVNANESGLYPVLDTRRGLVNPNEPGAQTLIGMAGAARRVSAPVVSRVIDSHYSGAAIMPPAPPQLPTPAATWPGRVEVYQAPVPRSLALPVGVDGSGRQVALPLRNLGNVLVGGLPGSGKSELLASMIAGLLRQDPAGARVQVAAVDTKLVSFGLMPDMPALYARPALTLDDASALIAQLAAEVQRRFELLYSARARSLEELESSTGERLPYLVAFVDELADLTTDQDRRRSAAFLAYAQEIGRKGRAAGVALVVATQRPSADVIPSSLRNLAGASVAFRLAKADDSRLVLGDAGAEVLPAAPGRCLVRLSDTTQAQAYYAGLEGGQFDTFCSSLPAQPLRGVPVYNWPTTGPVGTVAQGGPRLEPGREPDEQLAAAMRTWYAQGVSKTAICQRVWGYKDGAVWAILDGVLSEV